MPYKAVGNPRIMPIKPLPVAKPVAIPGAGKPFAPKANPLPTENKILRQFATKPVVNPLGKVRTKAITAPLKSYLP